MKKINVLILCLYDAAGIFSKFNYFLNSYKKYFNCKIVQFSRHSFGYEYDIDSIIFIDDIESTTEFKKLIAEADVIQFGLENWEHPAYRIFDIDYSKELIGKRVFFLSVVSPYIFCPFPTLELAQKHNVYMLPIIYEETRYYPETIKQLNLPYPILNPFLEKHRLYNTKKKNKDLITLFHSPTSLYIKNSTPYLQVAYDLKNTKKNIELIFNTNVSYERNMKDLLKADIVYDEMWVLSLWGQIGVEATALGKPVLQYLSEESREYYKKICECDELPFIDCTPENIRQKLGELVDSIEIRNKWGKISAEWFWKHWSGKRTAERFYKEFKKMNTFK